MPRLVKVQLEHEVRREPLDVPLHSLDECARLDFIQTSQIGIQHHSMPT